MSLCRCDAAPEGDGRVCRSRDGCGKYRFPAAQYVNIGSPFIRYRISYDMPPEWRKELFWLNHTFQSHRIRDIETLRRAFPHLCLKAGKYGGPMWAAFRDKKYMGGLYYTLQWDLYVKVLKRVFLRGVAGVVAEYLVDQNCPPLPVVPF